MSVLKKLMSSKVNSLYSNYCFLLVHIKLTFIILHAVTCRTHTKCYVYYSYINLYRIKLNYNHYLFPYTLKKKYKFPKYMLSKIIIHVK
ncbi:hypothetical protein PFMALIP_00680 [Plasmodium falciparum MaliPS096_E11]|uniref:Uncharacterized protein n=2 Tax=Plasmodium falciparum TaxID=5833 RepID=A0A024XEF1_PLAFC|nr:hypothetical protein PFMALIP_00680 [Plasmodium falciparum MaliPS096_E11]ETW63460.1 hypothetical protein PFMC_00678 [Plasmodium falciparum CAMP/Malaysia]